LVLADTCVKGVLEHTAVGCGLRNKMACTTGWIA